VVKKSRAGWTSPQNPPWVVETFLSTQGSLHLPLAVAFFFITLVGFMLWGSMRHWRFLVETQLRLDRCVGILSHDFRDKLNALESSNQKMKIIRSTLAITPPSFTAPLQTALLGLVLQQDLTLAAWKVKQAQWILQKGCGNREDLKHPLPSFKFVRSYPDTLGPQPLTWEGIMPDEFYFKASHSPRVAAAKVEADQGSTGGNKNEGWNPTLGKKWKAVWSHPAQFKWASVH
jgi:hypothetical protein